MTVLLVASLAAAGALWAAIYISARRGWRVLQSSFSLAGSVFVWPVMALCSAVLFLNHIYRDIDDPVIHPVVVIAPAVAAAVAFSLWMTGVGLAVWLGKRANKRMVA